MRVLGRHVRNSLLLLPALLLGGCEWLDDWLNPDTQIAVDRCMRRVATHLVGERQAESYCIERHERPLLDNLDGRAGFNNVTGGFSGHVINPKADIVVTRFTVQIFVKETRKKATKTFIGAARFDQRFEFAFSADELKPLEVSTTPTKDEVEWTTSDVRGIRIVR